jgi:hypothetical protein
VEVCLLSCVSGLKTEKGEFLIYLNPNQKINVSRSRPILFGAPLTFNFSTLKEVESLRQQKNITHPHESFLDIN